MNEVVNLNRARKAKARTNAKTTAAENRIKFGRTKGEKSATEHTREVLARSIDGSKLDPK